MRPQRLVDPREPALGFQCSGTLAGVCYTVALMTVLYAGNKRLTGLMVSLWILFTIISYIVGTVWLRRCWANAEVLTPGGLPFGRGWATAGWLVPVLSIWMRWRISLGLWRASGVSGAPRLVHLWWGASLVSGGVGLATGFWNLHSTGVLVAVAFRLAHLALFIVVIQRISIRQAEALDVLPAHLSTADPAPGQPQDMVPTVASAPAQDHATPTPP